MWAFLNWALGLLELDCRVIWLERIRPSESPQKVRSLVSVLKNKLDKYGLGESLALYSESNGSLDDDLHDKSLSWDQLMEADLLLNFAYSVPAEVVSRFRRSALIDIDPGLLQIWMDKRQINVAPHDRYFTIGETVGKPEAKFPDAGINWLYTPPCVALSWWPALETSESAPFTTVSHWYAEEWMEEKDDVIYGNDKRSGFLPFLSLPGYVKQALELSLCLGDDTKERQDLEQRGWRVIEARTISSTPWDYQHYVQESRGEFSCAKPSCVKLQNAWISDRTLCYLASGKPAVVQYTGPSSFLPESEGLFRFRNMEEAIRYLAAAEKNYKQHVKAARRLAEEFFDAKKVLRNILQQILA
jgi:hypothetical protein